MAFDAEGYFRNRGVRCWTEGKNVRHGWINIQCIFCDDHSNHLGVNPEGGYSCWRCRAHGGIVKLVKYIDRSTYEQARTVAKEYGKDFASEVVPPSSDRCRTTADGEVLPSRFTPKLPPRHKAYLEARKYNPKAIIRKYRIGYIPGKWRNRIIIPMYMRSRLVAFSGRDITGMNEPKYLLGNFLIDRNSIIYNIDNIPNRIAVIVEGYTDVWRIGDGAVAIMGTNFSNDQLLLLSQVADKALVLFDEHAYDVGEELANQLSGVIPTVDHMTIESRSGREVDPDTLPPDLIKKIRNEIWA